MVAVMDDWIGGLIYKGNTEEFGCTYKYINVGKHPEKFKLNAHLQMCAKGQVISGPNPASFRCQIISFLSRSRPLNHFCCSAFPQSSPLRSEKLLSFRGSMAESFALALELN